MRIHADWATAAFDLRPAADATGAFTGRGFLAAWWRHRGTGELLLVESDDALLPFHRVDATIRFLGEADLTDYHSPLGPGAADLLAEFAAGLDPGTRLDLDSLPAEAAGVVIGGIGRAGLSSTSTRHEAAAVVPLPATHDEYLASLSGKQRHEVRRKRRRFIEMLGEPRVVRDSSRLAEFVAMHRSAEGRKGRFMTAEMEKLFGELLELPDATLDLLTLESGEAVAAAFGFEDAETAYLYNSSYDSAAAGASPGAVLIDELIAGAIERGRRRFDFLKGDEDYKFRLGASERPLVRVEAVR